MVYQALVAVATNSVCQSVCPSYVVIPYDFHFAIGGGFGIAGDLELVKLLGKLVITWGNIQFANANITVQQNTICKYSDDTIKIFIWQL